MFTLLLSIREKCIKIFHDCALSHSNSTNFCFRCIRTILLGTYTIVYVVNLEQVDISETQSISV
jgi:hypothetical protein